MRAIVIGAGIGGIAAAIRTARKGYRVHVYEAGAGPGGKLSSFHEGAYRFDRGPSLFTMPHYVDELFAACGENPRDHFAYERQDVVCRYFWDDGTALTAFADPDAFAEEAERALGVDRAVVTEALTRAQRKYDVSGKTFLEKPLHLASTWLDRRVADTLTKLGDMDLTATMHEVNARTLGHPKLVQLFDRFATYNGSNPYRAPGILTVIPTFEHLIGTFLPRGGMYDVTEALVGLAERQGVRFHYGQPVARVLHTGNRVTGVEFAGGRREAADLIVSNSDVHGFYHRLMPAARRPARTLAQERSTSAVIFYWGLRERLPQIGLHNIFFSEDYAAEFAALQRGEIADDCTVYVNATARFVAGEAPPGHDNWFVMVNAPYDRGQDWAQTLARVRARVIAKLSAILGVDVGALVTVERTWAPPGIASDTGSHLGALYGTSSNSRWAAFLRHRNRSREFDNLYFVGGSVHPGGGVPLALLSARIANDLMPEPAAAR